MNTIPIKRALISVADKTDVIELAQGLLKLSVEIISTGGTSQILKLANIPHRTVDEVTGQPEMLGGRVKTLHPLIHGGILGRRDQHEVDSKKHNIAWIDLVVVNFYPFQAATTESNLNVDKAVEFIDIGGPTMVRGAAKNFAWVSVLVDPKDYAPFLAELQEKKGITEPTRQRLAAKVFALTSQYDMHIAQYFEQRTQNHEKEAEGLLHLNYKKVAALRYGENPHQQAVAYQNIEGGQGVLAAQVLQGKALSYNNLVDAEAALLCVNDFEDPTCAIIKHANPCGIAAADTIATAYQRALSADEQSAFGGIVSLNRSCDGATAAAIMKVFTEVVIAPDYSREALALFKAKPNLRLLKLPSFRLPAWEKKFITGGLLMQSRDDQQLTATALRVVTETKPDKEMLENMLFAWRAIKHIKSNAILLAKGQATVGIGAGQVSRIDAVQIAFLKAGDNALGCVLASDAFFPFRDSIDVIAQGGVKAVIQPGGSVRDAEVIKACNEHGIAMVFTGKRCFKH